MQTLGVVLWSKWLVSNLWALIDHQWHPLGWEDRVQQLLDLPKATCQVSGGAGPASPSCL